MSGHSKWSTIKHQKGVADARRGQLFTKLAREITVAARQGGQDPESNVRLRLAAQKAKDNNMPTENIERAIRRGAGTGEDGHESLQEVLYEGYGPGGSAILLEAVTDNPHRTVSEVRNVFTRGGGALGEKGCVAWNFESKGVITVEAPPGKAEELALAAIDGGAEDFDADRNVLEVRTGPDDFEGVRRVLEAGGAKVLSAELAFIPKSVVPLDARHGEQTLRLLERMEELDDVQHVYTNATFPNEVLAQSKGAA
ncbi:MAG: YebC/PmpR family DNA-binding transcriptional regulator [Chloroflexi bacterium]|nr:YebC/PmpR family DNA-binding transcriptional regulator [Chloroflexota bacterium]